MKKLTDDITAIKGIGAKKAQDLHNLGLWQAEDVLYYFPFRYEDRTVVADLSTLKDGQMALICGEVAQVNNVRLPGRKILLRVVLRSFGGKITLLWFNQPYLAQKFSLGKIVLAYGRYHYKGEKQLAVKDYRILAEEEEAEQYLGIVPVYPASEKISANMLQKLVDEALKGYLPVVGEYLPEAMREKYHLADLAWALEAIHHPKEWKDLNIARYRLVFDEFLLLILSLRQKKRNEKKLGLAQRAESTLTKEFLADLPFQLTYAQKRVILEIKRDMESPYAMHRLLQGDVGSGKTIVALYALLKTIENNCQGVLMVPTEILAEQHYLTMNKYLAKSQVKLRLLTSSLNKAKMNELKEQISLGKIDLIIGTHALLEDNVEFKSLGLVIIDEQHRFGVRQQLVLQNKGANADLLVMTATPIPRSLALTIYGDLDLSVIDELPQGRKKIITWHIGEKKREGMYGFLAEKMAKGEQVYVVCPLVSQSEKMDLANAEALAHKLAQEVFPQRRIALLHGKMKNEEKAQIMEKFRLGEIDLLVATTVIEVGVDVPNATVMVIENAERFGLAQLHQLRGRVGRGEKQGYCILISEPTTDEAKSRMQVMTKSNDGFFIAEEDLNIRGPGEVLGLKQHGLPELKIANLAEDIAILEAAKEAAEQILAEGLEHYPKLTERLERVRTSKILTMNGGKADGQFI